jgi:uncharacterized membrane protein
MTIDHTEPAEAPVPEPPLIHKVELAISYILRGGVLVSLILVLIGTVLTFAHHPTYINRSLPLTDIPNVAADFPHTIPDTWDSVTHGRGQGFIILGLIVLLGTPVIRVVASIIAFYLQKDWPFVLITLTVLAILITSFILGKAEGG